MYITSGLQNNEHVIDYVQRWRNLSLNFKNKLSESSPIEIYIKSMKWGLSYILQKVKLSTFKELVTRAHNMELSISDAINPNILIQDPNKSNDKQKTHKTTK